MIEPGEAGWADQPLRAIREAPATLAKKACLGGGPIFEYFGRVPYYRTESLDRYAESRLSGPRRSTSDLGQAALIERERVTWPDERPASPAVPSRPVATR
jgi:hypothetical protein